MTEAQVKFRWIVSGAISFVLFIILLILMPSLPDFHDLKRVAGTVDESTASTRRENGSDQSLFMITLDGNSDNTYVVMKGQDLGYYRATQVVASGDDVTLWTYPIHQSSDLRVWQLSDRSQLVVNYNEVYGFEKHFRNQIVTAFLLLLCAVNGWTYFVISQGTTEPPEPRLMEFGG